MFCATHTYTHTHIHTHTRTHMHMHMRAYTHTHTHTHTRTHTTSPGTFEPVRDITLKNTSYTVVVQWSPPDHLPSIPPTNYNITIINTTSAGIIDSDTLTTTNHTFHLDPEHLCSVLLIHIVAYNQWLNGQPGEIAWSLGGMVIVPLQTCICLASCTS